MERRTELTHAPCLIFIVAIVAASVTLETSIAAIDALKAAVSSTTRRDFRGKSGAPNCREKINLSPGVLLA